MKTVHIKKKNIYIYTYTYIYIYMCVCVLVDGGRESNTNTWNPTAMDYASACLTSADSGKDFPLERSVS